MSVSESKHDDDVCRLGLVRFQGARSGSRSSPQRSRPWPTAPPLGRPRPAPGSDSIAVEEKRVFSKQIVELGNHWMVLRYGLRFELADRSLDLCGREFHRILLAVWLRLKAEACGASLGANARMPPYDRTAGRLRREPRWRRGELPPPSGRQSMRLKSWATLALRERDDDVSRFGLVRLQAIRIGLAPVGKIYHFGRLRSRPGRAGRLDDAEPVAVEEERVLPEQVVQLRNRGVVSGITSPWNCLKVRSTCTEFNFIAHSFPNELVCRLACTRCRKQRGPPRAARALFSHPPKST